MRITIQLSSRDNSFFIPFVYNEYIQALIYRLLPDKEGANLHERGFVYEKRSFKLFTYSRLIGKLEKSGKSQGLIFKSPVKLIISSPVEWILQNIANALIQKGEIQLGSQFLNLDHISVHNSLTFSEKIKIKMLSPMTAYSTLNKPDGGKITHYYTPHEQEFSRLISANLQKKTKLIYNTKRNGDVFLKPLFRGNREHIIKYKGFIIKAWDGIYELTGDPELIRVSYETGLGSKNSQGFGLWEAVSDA